MGDRDSDGAGWGVSTGEATEGLVLRMQASMQGRAVAWLHSLLQGSKC